MTIESQRIRRAETKAIERSDAVWAAPDDIDHLKQLTHSSTDFLTTYHLGDESLLDLDDLSFDANNVR